MAETAGRILNHIADAPDDKIIRCTVEMHDYFTAKELRDMLKDLDPNHKTNWAYVFKGVMVDCA